MNRLLKASAAFALTACTLTTAQAGEPDAFAPVAPPVEEDGWNVALMPYFWFAGLDGDVGFNGNVGEVDMDFGDIWDTLEFGLMGAAHFQKGKWGFQLDGIWMQLEDDAKLQGPINADLNAEIEMARIQGLITYELFDNGPTQIYVKGGAAWFYMSLDFDVKGGRGLGRGIDGSESESFIDPMFAAVLHHDLTERWYIDVRGQIGGFGVESDFIWQVGGFLGYRINERYSIGAGYRHLDIDYRQKDFVFDASMSGPYVGGKIQF